MIIDLKIISFFLRTIPPNWRYVDKSSTIFYKGSSFAGKFDSSQILQAKVNKLLQLFLSQKISDLLHIFTITSSPINSDPLKALSPFSLKKQEHFSMAYSFSCCLTLTKSLPLTNPISITLLNLSRHQIIGCYIFQGKCMDTCLALVRVPSTSNKHILFLCILNQLQVNYIIDTHFNKQNCQMSQKDLATETANQLQKKIKFDFYRLHYPQRKQYKSVSKVSNKMRSKSVISVIQSPPNQQKQFATVISPKNSIKKAALHRSNPNSNFSSQLPKSPQKYKDNLSFKTALSPNFSLHRDYFSALPITSLKDIEEQSKKNLNIRLAMQKAKDEKIKMNRIILSHKQSEQIKLEYLRNKKYEIEDSIKLQIRAIYEQFFKKEYETAYGSSGEDKFQDNIELLLAQLTKRIFYH